MANDGDLLTVGQAAKLVGKAENTIRYWSRTGRLAVAHEVGKRTKLYDREAVLRAAETAEGGGSGEAA